MLNPAVFVIGAAALVVVRLIWNVFRPGLFSIPGPWPAKFSNLYRVVLIWRGRISHDILDMHRKYGPVVRLGPDTVSIADRRVVEDIYGAKTNFPKSDWVKSSQTLYQGKVVPALMTTQDKAYHHTLKKSVASAYSVTTLMGYEKSVEETVTLFLRRLDEEFIQTGKQCALHDWLQWYAYDVIGVITMSRTMGFLEQGKDIDNMLGEIRVEADYRAMAAQMPSIDYWFRKNPIIKRLKSPTHKIMIRARQMLDERLADGGSKKSNRQDFIARFLQAKEKHPETLNDRNMLGFVGSNLQAGSDTTAIALRTIMYYAMKDQRVLSKLRKEIDESEVQHPIPFQHAFHEMPYTSAVIQEALRIHPPFAMLLERSVPAEGLELPDGTKLHCGTRVGMFGYTMHRDPEIYGVDADYFNPDRWLQGEKESCEDYKCRLRTMKAFDMSFGTGSRACLGKHVAELQIFKLVPAFVGLLDVEYVNPDKPWKLDERFFGLQSDMDVRIRWREGKSLKDMEPVGYVSE